MRGPTATFRPAEGAVWFTGRPWQPGLLIAHMDASPWNAVWADGVLAGFVDWDTIINDSATKVDHTNVNQEWKGSVVPAEPEPAVAA